MPFITGAFVCGDDEVPVGVLEAVAAVVIALVGCCGVCDGDEFVEEGIGIEVSLKTCFRFV